MMTRLYLVRHGATQLTAEDRFAGSIGVDLSEEGRWQARQLGERLRSEGITAAYCSPLSRSADTARIIAGPCGVTPIDRDGLREISHGHWEGLTRREVEERFPAEYTAWEEDPFTFAPEGGESGVSVLARALPAIRDIVTAHPGQTSRRRLSQGDAAPRPQQPARLRCAGVSRSSRSGAGLSQRARLQGSGPRASDAVQRHVALLSTGRASPPKACRNGGTTPRRARSFRCGLGSCPCRSRPLAPSRQRRDKTSSFVKQFRRLRTFSAPGLVSTTPGVILCNPHQRRAGEPSMTQERG